MTESLIKKEESKLSAFVKFEAITEGTDDKRSYRLAIDSALTLAAARAVIDSDLKIGERWNFLEDGAELTASAEKILTVGELAEKSSNVVTLRRDKSATQRREAAKAEREAQQEKEETKLDKQESRREEKEKKELEYMAATMTKLNTLQAEMVTPNKLLKEQRDLELLTSKLVAGKSSTGESLRELDPEKITNLIKSLGLPRTASRALEDGAFQVTSFVARLRPEQSGDNGESPAVEGTYEDALSTLAARYTTAVNEIETRAESFQEEWQKKACESGFSQISAALSLSYKGPAFKGALAAKFEQSEQQESQSQNKGDEVFMVGIQEVRKARVYTPPHMIRLSTTVEDEFSKASKLGAEALRPLFDRHGYFVITEYTLGGRLSSSSRQRREGTASEMASKFKRSFGAAIDAQGGGAALSASAAYKGEKEKSEANTAQKASENFQLSARGGKVTERDNPKEWTESLAVDNWEIISYDRLIPIYDFIADESVRNSCRTAVQEMAKASENKRQEAEKVAAQSQFARWAVMSRSISDLSRSKGHKPADRNSGRPFSEQRMNVQTQWTDVPQGMYFKGAQLKIDGDWLRLCLLVTNAERSSEQIIEPPTGNLGLNMGGQLGDGGLFFDKTVLYFAPQERIVGLRLDRLSSPSNRVGLQVKLANLDGVVQRTLMNNQDNEHDYDPTDRCKACVSPTVVPDGQVVTGIRLENTGDGAYAIEIYSLPVS